MSWQDDEYAGTKPYKKEIASGCTVGAQHIYQKKIVIFQI